MVGALVGALVAVVTAPVAIGVLGFGAGGIPVRLMGLPPVLLQRRWWPHIKVEAWQLEVQWL